MSKFAFNDKELQVIWNALAAYKSDLGDTIEQAEGDGDGGTIPGLREELKLATAMLDDLDGYFASFAEPPTPPALVVENVDEAAKTLSSGKAKAVTFEMPGAQNWRTRR